MLSYLVRRTVATVFILIGVSLVVFFAIRLTPGDPARQILGPLAPQERVVELRKELGLDKPIWTQYGIWLKNAVRGDFGTSIASNAPALELVLERMLRTLELTMAAFLITVVLAITGGVLAAVYQYSLLDNFLTFSSLFWLSMPRFWLGLMFMLLFATRIPGLPISGSGGPIGTWSNLVHLILPALTLGLQRTGALTRIVRSSMLDVLQQDYIATARSKGLRNSVVIYKHALRNAMNPIITMIGLQLPWLFGGSVVVETVFSWPGMGRLLTTAIFERDYPLVQAVAIFYTLAVVAANYLADISYAISDPRIRLE